MVDDAHIRPPMPPIHPVLVAAFPLLALYAANVNTFPLGQLLRPLGMSIVGSGVLWLLLALFMRNARRSAVATSAVVLAFYSYGHLRNLLPAGAQGLVIPTCSSALAVVLIVVLRSRRTFARLTRAANLASIVLIAPSLWTIGTARWSPATDEADANDAGPHWDASRFLAPEPAVVGEAHPDVPSITRDRPDVYYIILDAYGRADRLKQIFSLDNTSFINALEKRGFYVTSHSTANYDQTSLCLASSLNLNYLQMPLDPRFSHKETRAPVPLRRMIDENRVVDYLRNLGYKYVNIWSGLEETRIKTADTVLNVEDGDNTFEGETMGLTALEATQETQRGRYDRYRQRMMDSFKSLKTVASLSSPKFVFAHIPAPHPPFVLGPNGEALYPNGPMGNGDGSWLLKVITRAEYARGYTGQLQYINRRVIEALDAILRRSRKPPIIILQADHGSRMNMDWDSLQRTDVREPFSILNAYYVPPDVRVGLYDSISPVNTFRVLLSRHFGGNYRLLPDRSFYSSAGKPFEFTEVTPLLSRIAAAESRGGLTNSQPNRPLMQR